MEQPKVELVACNKCGRVREKFLIECPECGNIGTQTFEPEKQVFYEITLETIANGKRYYQKELDDAQRKFFNERIPSDQNWQFYAGIVLINNLNTVWLRDLQNREKLTFDDWSEPISCGNARVFFIMSYKSKEKQQHFCDLINAYNHHRIKHEKENDLQGEASGNDDAISTGGTSISSDS